MSQTLAQEAEYTLWQAILQQKIKPAHPITVAQLSEQFMLGASPVREALTSLSHQQLLKFTPNKGYQLKELSRTDLEQIQRCHYLLIQELLKDLEGVTDEQWKLEILSMQHAKRHLPFPKKRTDEARENLHISFHLALLNAGKNDLMRQFHQQVLKQHLRYLYHWLLNGEQTSLYTASHEMERIVRGLLSAHPSHYYEQYKGYWRQLYQQIFAVL